MRDGFEANRDGFEAYREMLTHVIETIARNEFELYQCARLLKLQILHHSPVPSEVISVLNGNDRLGRRVGCSGVSSRYPPNR